MALHHDLTLVRQQVDFFVLLHLWFQESYSSQLGILSIGSQISLLDPNVCTYVQYIGPVVIASRC